MAAGAAAARVFRAAGGAPAPSAAADQLPPLTVVTYNLLADKFAAAHASYCPPDLLDWRHRAPRLVAELLSYRADVLALQEVERPFLEDELEPALRGAGYAALFYGRRRKASDAVPGPEDGVCLAWDARRLERLASRAVRFGDLVPEHLAAASGSQAAAGRTKFWRAVAEREDGAVLALLRDKQAGRVLLAASAHLFWDPRWPDAKAAQAALLCRAATAFLRQHGGAAARWAGAGGVAAALAGDFNSLPAKTASDEYDQVAPGETLVSGAYELMTRGVLGADHPDHPAARRRAEAAPLRAPRLDAAGLALRSACADAWGAEPDHTNRTATFRGCLDYVFYSPQHFEVAAALEMPYGGGGGGGEAPEGGEALPPLPNEQWPSDHLAVGVQLRWR
jgi:CCR4-NOT transcription complex subunit 6